MGIVFYCQSCGARFEVEARQAGKKGRCSKCGQHMVIPRAEEIASMSTLAPVAVAMPAGRSAVPAAGVGAGVGVGAGGSARVGRRGGEAPAATIASWLKAGISQVGLAPLSVDRMPPVRPTLPSALGDGADADSKPYALADPRVENRGPVRIQDNLALRLWRRELGGFQKVFRWLSESAYFVSIPFVMILLLGAAVKSRPMALFGATFVVLLNVGRLAAGVANLAIVPLRDGLAVSRYRKPVRRVVEPIVTIALVFLAFTFIPWLSRTTGGRGGVGQRIRDGARGLERDIEGEVHDVLGKARKVDLQRISEEARRKLEGLGETKPGGGEAPRAPARDGP